MSDMNLYSPFGQGGAGWRGKLVVAIQYLHIPSALRLPANRDSGLGTGQEGRGGENPFAFHIEGTVEDSMRSWRLRTF